MTLFNILRTVHIAGGFTSLLLGIYILLSKKGNKLHRLVGSIYFFAMLVSAFVALPMSYIHPNYFLFIVGVFTSFMLLSGKRYLNKRQDVSVSILDWILTSTMFAAAIGFIIIGVYHLYSSSSFGIVFLVFGGIGVLFVYQDFINFKGKSKIKNYGLTTHIQRMMGSYIASVTAFLVVNNTLLPDVMVWLFPTLVLVPLIMIWTRKYKIEKQ